jgi:hypothetical protein
MAKIISTDLAVLLTSIVNSEFQNGPVVDNAVWTDCLDHGFTKQKVGGLFSAGVKAQLIGINTYDKNEQTCWITAAGLEALNAYMAAQQPGLTSRDADI